MGGPIAAEARALVEQCDDLIIRVVVDEDTSEEQTYNLSNFKHDESCSQFTGKIDIPVTKNTYRLKLQYWVVYAPYGEVLLLTTEALQVDIASNASSSADFAGSSYLYPDTDGDGYTNADEMKAGAHPSNDRSMPRLSPPTDLSLEPIDYNIVVRWTAEPDATYTLYLATQPEFTKSNTTRTYDNVRPGFKFPEPELEPGQTYYVAVTATNRVGQESDLSAIREAVPRLGVPPGIESVYPARDASDVGRSIDIEINFTEPMAKDSVESAFSMKDLTLDSGVSGEKIYDTAKKQLLFSVEKPLNFASKYEVTLSNAKTLSDKPLRDVQWQFSTRDGGISMGEGVTYPGLADRPELPTFRSNAEGVVIALWKRGYATRELEGNSDPVETGVYGSVYVPDVGWLPSEMIARYGDRVDKLDGVVQRDGSILVVWASNDEIRFNVGAYDTLTQRYVWKNSVEDYEKDGYAGVVRAYRPQTGITDFDFASNDDQAAIAVWIEETSSDPPEKSIHARRFTNAEWQHEEKIAEDVVGGDISGIRAVVTQANSTLVAWTGVPQNTVENESLFASAYFANGWSERVQVGEPTMNIDDVWLADLDANQVSVVWLREEYDMVIRRRKIGLMEQRLRIDLEGGPPAMLSRPTVLVEGGTGDKPSVITGVRLAGVNGYVVLAWIDKKGDSSKLYARRILPNQNWSSEEHIDAGSGDNFVLNYDVAITGENNVAILLEYVEDTSKWSNGLAYAKYYDGRWQTEIVRDHLEGSWYSSLALVLDKRARPRLFWHHTFRDETAVFAYVEDSMTATSLEANGEWAKPRPIPQAFVADVALENVGDNRLVMDWIQLDAKSEVFTDGTQHPIHWTYRDGRLDSLVHKAARFEGIFTDVAGWHDVSELILYKWINTATSKLVTHVNQNSRIAIGESKGKFYSQIKTISDWQAPYVFDSWENVAQRSHFVRLENMSGQLQLVWNVTLPPARPGGRQGQALYLRHYDPERGWRSRQRVFKAEDDDLYIKKGISNRRGDIVLVGSSINLNLSEDTFSYSRANAHVKSDGMWRAFDNDKFDSGNGACTTAAPGVKKECPSQRAEDVAFDDDGNAVGVWIQREVAGRSTPFLPMIYRYFRAEPGNWFESNPIALEAGSLLGDVRVRSGVTGETHLVWSVDNEVWTSSIQDLGDESENWSEPKLLAEGHDSGLSNMVLETDHLGNFLLSWKSMDANGAPAVNVRRYTVTRGWTEPRTTFDLDSNVVDISALDVEFMDDGSAMLAWGQVWKNEQGPVIGTALFK